MSLGPFRPLWEAILSSLEWLLKLYEGAVEPIVGPYSWGVAIIFLTITVRFALMPLMVKQTRSMREMQAIQPELKKIREKYKVDRSLMKSDPEKYRAMKQKEQEAQAAVMKEHQVNPAGGCLPMFLQMPIFIALFRLLRGTQIPEIATAQWFLVENLGVSASQGAGIGAIILIVFQAASTYYQMRLSSARTPSGGTPEQEQMQKMMMYGMPVMLAFMSWSLPVGVVLYWVTTNIWSVGQQWFILRTLDKEEEAAAEARDELRDPKRERRQRRAEQSGAATGTRNRKSDGTEIDVADSDAEKPDEPQNKSYKSGWEEKGEEAEATNVDDAGKLSAAQRRRAKRRGTKKN